MTSHQATELTPDELGNFTEGEKVYFAFRTFSTSNPTTEPTAILTNVMVKNSILATEGVETNHFIPYSCKIVEGEISRGGYIKLDYALAKELVVHLENRNTSDIKHTNELEILINNSATVEEVNAINW
ncbi:MAG: hypothetical protein HWN81_15015 [Candidatus Lokiarchaeota archaeon]|nr:hypothetical protein [Candidatus Lokiarchaeota archaeon]